VSGNSEMRENETDPARDALALPREIAPPQGLWTGVEARIKAKRRRALVFRRGVTASSMLLAAAAVILSIRSAKQPGPGPAPITSESLRVAPPRAVPTTIDDPAAVLLVPEEASYLAALAALAPKLEEQEKSLPEKDVAAVGASIHAIDAAIVVTRASLEDHPEDADLRGELDAEYEQKIDAINDVLEWTTRS
jgi:hypothetical protein